MNAEIVRQRARERMHARGWRKKLAKRRPHEPSMIRCLGTYVPRDGLQGTLRPVAGRP